MFSRGSVKLYPILKPALLFFVVVIGFIPIKAQICTGSLGDPAVNITFGSPGANSDYKAPGSYGYNPSICPNDGYYTITDHTLNCFGNVWHTISSDHTGGGRFLLVNASQEPGDFFLDTVTNLCPNTTYEFAAWVMNVMNNPASILPDITFKIEKPDGTLLSSFNTGGIAVTTSPTWRQYGFFFTTPPGNPLIVLRMTNNAPGGFGNDIALDDITFRPCGLKINANITGLSTDTVNICEDNSNVYSFNSSVAAGYISPLFQWQESTDKGISWNDIPGATTLTYTRLPVTRPGSYWYRLTVIESSVASISSCRIASDLIIINVHPNPIVNAGPDRVMIAGHPSVLDARAEGEQITYTWAPPDFMNDNSVLDPTVSPPHDIEYTLSVISAFGCTNSDTALVKVVAGIFVPTAFSPNGDGKNDVWEIPFLDPSYQGEVSVFNRWGQLVYHTKDALVSWDGKLKGESQPSGTYVYMVNFRKGNYQNLRGTITLIR